MTQYQKKPIVIEANQLTEGEPWPEGVNWNATSEQMYVTTIQGVDVPIRYGEWVISEGDGVHFYPCDGEVFERVYEPVQEPDEPTFDEELWNELLAAYRKLAAAKPNDRSEKDRRFAVAIAKYQDVLAWVHTMIVSEFEG